MSEALWLASGSPRRLRLLEWCGLSVEVHPPEVDEALQPGDDPVTYAARLAVDKVGTAPAAVLALAADTVVHREGRVFDKPVDREHARSHLQELAGGWHRVTTAVAARRGEVVRTVAVTSEVRFRTLSDAEIADYLASGEADDKAGAYGIQGRGGSLVAEVRGSWTNVMGLPLEETLDLLEELGEPGSALRR